MTFRVLLALENAKLESPSAFLVVQEMILLGLRLLHISAAQANDRNTSMCKDEYVYSVCERVGWLIVSGLVF